MERFQDRGIFLHGQAFGEKAFIASVFTVTHGRCKGLMGKGSMFFLPGQEVEVSWRSRLEEQLGHFQGDVFYDHLLPCMAYAPALSAVHLICFMLHKLLPEKIPCPELYLKTIQTFHVLPREQGLLGYLQWETCLLETLGHPFPIVQSQESLREPKWLLILQERQNIFQEYFSKVSKRRAFFLETLGENS